MIPITQLGRIIQDIQLQPIEREGNKNFVLNNVLAIKQSKEITIFLDFTVWGKLAETIASIFKKGDEIILIGELRNKKNSLMIQDKENPQHFKEKELTSLYLLVKGFEFTNGNKHQK